MANKVIIFVADNNYIERAKSIAVNCREEGKWEGDFAVICPTNSEAAAEFNKFGFHVLETSFKGFLQKFEVFSDYFQRWDEALYMDCDIIVQDDINKLFSLLQVENRIWMDTEDCSTMASFWRDTNKVANKPVYDLIEEKYPTVNNQSFNSAFMLFYPDAIPPNAPEKLMAIQREIEPVNRMEEGGTDQQVINLLLWEYCKKIPNKMVCFWGLAEPQNDVDSDFRQFKKGDVPIAIHYTRWYAQWIKKTEDMDAYLVRKLDVPCHDFYQKKLSLFNQIFQ